MTLRELLQDTGDVRFALHGDDRVAVTRVTDDSRSVEPGDVFVALRGTAVDGGRFAADACRRGAVAVIGAPGLTVPAGATYVATDAAGRLLAHVAARLHGQPTAALTMVGITGTNGKTTVSFLLEAIWQAAGFVPAVIGTINYRCGALTFPALHTTPPAPELFARLAAMRAAGATHVAMEVSSHALAQGRADAVAWDAAIFTNLGRDHLDYHRDLDDYRAAKARLLEALDVSPKPARVAVLNAADPKVASLAAGRRVPVVTFGPGGDVQARRAELGLTGTRAEVTLGGETLTVETALIGAGHVENVLAAAAAAHALGVPPATIARGLAALRGVPGRLEPIPTGRGFTVLVDYAHTPDALAGVLDTLRPLVAGRLICVFGCGGDRDRGKRPLMGEAVGRRADLAILTSDNPRTEEPLAIIADAERGLAATRLARRRTMDAGGYLVERDRRAAIATALAGARAGDCVVIAGKGHEDYQIVGRTRHPFDDRVVARELLAAGGAG